MKKPLKNYKNKENLIKPYDMKDFESNKMKNVTKATKITKSLQILTIWKFPVPKSTKTL